MKVASSIRPAGVQETIWEWVGDKPLLTNAGKRHAVGLCLEERAATLLRAHRLDATGSNNICPDLRFQNGDYGEVKGCAKEGIVFEHRIRKDLALIKQEKRMLWYVYMLHHIRFDLVTSTHVARDHVYRSVYDVCIVSALALWKNRKKAKEGLYYYRANGKEKGDPKVTAWRFSSQHIQRMAGKIVTIDDPVAPPPDNPGVQIRTRNTSILDPQTSPTVKP